jgi:ribosome-associated protein
MTALLGEFAGADRQKLRQLVRNTHEERERNKPPHAFRELYRELRELTAQDDAVADQPADDMFDEGDEGHA